MDDDRSQKHPNQLMLVQAHPYPKQMALTKDEKAYITSHTIKLFLKSSKVTLDPRLPLQFRTFCSSAQPQICCGISFCQ